jgi:ATP-binding cassette ChvD family protein
MAEQFIFTMLGLNKFYGQRQVLKEINLCFYPGAKIGIVGENGSGKSTVLRIMAGLEKDFLGKAEISRGYRAGIVMQDPILDPKLTVRATIEQAFADKVALVKEYERLANSMAEPMSDEAMQKTMDRMQELQDKIDACDGWNLDQHIRVASEALFLPEEDRLVGTLSGGEKRRVALCKALLDRPELLLLDEPTNHLDPETVDWLEGQLREYPGTVIIVTHDRYFLDNITKWILELDGGRGIPWEGNYSSWMEQKLTRIGGEEREKGNKESPRVRALRHELAWIRMSGKEKANLSRSRLAEYSQLVAREAAAAREDASVIQIAPGPELGDQVIEVKGVTKGYGERPLFKDLDIQVPKGAVIGVVGPNGAGKTTLFKLILGLEKADAGEIKVGPTVKFAYAEQEAGLVGEHDVLEEITGGASEVVLGKQRMPARVYASRFGFKGQDQGKKVSQLSGGERNRCRLAKVLKVGGNVLLLDEPTNDLDVNTLRMLEEAIQNYSGCALVISHDRFFLDRISTHTLAFEGDGVVRLFPGPYQAYEDWRVKEHGKGLFENRRNRYRKIVKG